MDEDEPINDPWYYNSINNIPEDELDLDEEDYWDEQEDDYEEEED
jgi:hypothetical protein